MSGQTPMAEGFVSAGASPTIPEMEGLFAAANIVAPPPMEWPMMTTFCFTFPLKGDPAVPFKVNILVATKAKSSPKSAWLGAGIKLPSVRTKAIMYPCATRCSQMFWYASQPMAKP